MNEETWWDVLKRPIIFIAIIVLLLIIIYSNDNSNWNGGYCYCGGKWEYRQAVGHKAGTNYIYKCDKCGKVHEFEILR